MNAFKDQRGLSLIEVLVGAVIVGIAAIGVALMFGAGQAYIEAEATNREALTLAQQRIEQIRAMGHTQVMLTWTPPRLNIIEATIPNHPGYRRTTHLLCLPPDDFNGPPWEDCTASASNPELIPPVGIVVQVRTSPVNQKARMVELRAVMAAR